MAASKLPKAESFMFTMYAKKADISKNSDGSYTLAMEKTDFHHVIAFSDRPERVVKDISATFLAKEWGEGEDIFRKDPPNAVLSGSNLKPHIIILNSIKVLGSTVLYNVSSKSSPNKHLQSVVLVIDGISPAALASTDPCVTCLKDPSTCLAAYLLFCAVKDPSDAGYALNYMFTPHPGGM